MTLVTQKVTDLVTSNKLVVKMEIGYKSNLLIPPGFGLFLKSIRARGLVPAP